MHHHCQLGSKKHFPFAPPDMKHQLFQRSSAITQSAVGPVSTSLQASLRINPGKYPTKPECEPHRLPASKLCSVVSYYLVIQHPSCHCKHLRAEIQKTTASQSKRKCTTHHFEIFRPTQFPPEVAREKHVPDVMARSIIELEHVKRARLKVLEVSFDLQSLQNALLDQVNIPNLISETEEKNAEIMLQSFRYWRHSS